MDGRQGKPGRNRFRQEVGRENEAKRIDQLPVIGRVAFGINKLSGFGFVEWQKEQKPVYGIDLEYVYSINEELSGCTYGVASYKGESSRSKIIKTDFGYEVQKLEDDNYYAFVIGNKIDKSFLYNNWLDGISVTMEYYYDSENWTRSEFKNYLSYLDLLKSNRDNHSSLLAFGQDFGYSRSYMYLSLVFHGLVDEDFKMGFDMVANLEDGSRIYIPHLSYSFSNFNAVVGLKAKFYSGSADSEFANTVADNQILILTQVSL